MWKCDVATDIAAPIDVVYDYLADFQRHREWSTGVGELEQLTPGAIGEGTEFKASETVPVKFISYSRITVLDRPRRIAWQSWDNRTFRVQWEFDLSAMDGGTHLVQTAQFSPTSVLGTIMLNVMRKRQIPWENRQSLKRIKDLLEQGATKAQAGQRAKAR